MGLELQALTNKFQSQTATTQTLENQTMDLNCFNVTTKNGLDFRDTPWTSGFP
jgi:hypothetical protein